MSPRGASILLLILVGGIYGTLGCARPASEWLRGHGLLVPTLVVLALVSGMTALVLLRRDGRRQEVVPWVPLVLTFLSFVFLADYWRLPEERLHLVEYGLVGLLAWPVCRARMLPALLLAGLLGAGDELIQYFLPDRTFDPWDIVANLVASSAAVFLAAGGRRSWGAPALLLSARLLLPLVHLPHPGLVPAPLDPFAASSSSSSSSSSSALQKGSAQPLESAPFAGRSVLLVTIDALRADHVPPWGSAPVPTPTFDRLASESITFEEVYANSIWTTPSMQSLLTGLLPEVHGVQARGIEFPPSAWAPLEQLQGAGYRTRGFAGDGTETYNNLGFQSELNRKGDLVSEVVAYLRDEGPGLVWLHLRDIHAPYDASEERLAELGLPNRLPSSPILDRARSHALVPRRDFPGYHSWLQEPMAALYAAELADAERSLGELMLKLEEGGLLDKLLVVVTADHGEELLEHDGVGHASTTLDSAPHPETVEIPLYLRLPGAVGGSRVVPGRFEQVDLMPTLFPLLGLSLVEARTGVGLDGRDWSAVVLDSERPVLPPRPTLVSSTPCGWQCPPARRAERVHSLVDGKEWAWCRPPAAPCDGPIGIALSENHQRARLLREE
ncbi:MAG: sulfatase [Myxococcota bacterium]|nr:sulfatase [Myxococcota bacterium]